MARDQAQGDAELGDLRWQFGIERDEAQVSCGLDTGVQCAFEQRKRDAGNGGDREQRHQQAGIEDAARAGRCEA